MASHGGDVVSSDLFRNFFETFAATVNVNDPLPVKVGSHTIRRDEFDGEIVDWTLQYLQQKNCPSLLLAHLTSKILREVRQLIHGDETDAAITEERGFEPVKLMQLATSKINHVCMDYLNNQKFENLCEELSCVRQVQQQVSVHAIRNGRRKMEDRHVVLQDLNTICSLHDGIPTSYYAVFDGHAGTDAAFYAASQLHQILCRHKKFSEDPSIALKEAFLETDYNFTIKHEHERLKGGTTAVVALIRGNVLTVAWLGDSQAILVREGHGIQLVHPHKPDRMDEKQRISNLGGEVIYWDGAYRVNGQLAVSRAIGDVSYKPYVTAEPDIMNITLDGTEDFLVIGCDGLWDTVGVDEAAFLVLQYLHHEKDANGVGARLVQVAKHKGSTDNITVIVVFLRDPSLIARQPLPPAPETPPPSAQATPTMEEQRKEFEELSAKWGWSEPGGGGAVFDGMPWQQTTHAQDPFNGNGPTAPKSTDDKMDSMEQQRKEFEELSSTKWGWNDQQSGGVVFDDKPDSHFDSNDQPGWAQDSSQTTAELHNGAGGFESQDAPTSSFHLSSDGSTWDQTPSANPPGVDWNQYDDEASGQPSLMCWNAQETTDGVKGEEPVISPIEDFGDHHTESVRNDSSNAAVNSDQMWASEENSVTFPPFSTATDDRVAVEQQLMADETDFSAQLSDTVHEHGDGFGNGQKETPCLFSGQAAEVGISPKAEEATQPDFQWNLHAPEFEFRSHQPAPADEYLPQSLPHPSPANMASNDLNGDQTTAEDLLVNDAPVLVAPSSALESESPKSFEAEASSALVELVEPSGERKLSATELLVKSSSDAELAVLLAAANDDPDEMDPAEHEEPLDEILSPRYDNLDDQQALANESKGDGAMEAEDSDEDEDWTFYRNKGENKEESVMESEVTDTSLTKEVESKGELECVSTTCEANELGDQLQRLAVEDEASAGSPSPVPTLKENEIEDPIHDASHEPVVTEESNQSGGEPVAEVKSVAVEETPIQPEVAETVQCASEAPVATESQPVANAEPLLAAEPVSEAEPVVEEASLHIDAPAQIPVQVLAQVVEEQPVAIIEEKPEENQKVDAPPVPEVAPTSQVREASPISDTGATVGSDSVVAVPTAVGKVSVTDKAAPSKKATTPVKKGAATSSATSKTSTTKETAKKAESATRRPPVTEPKTVESKPARPTKLSPLRKATPATTVALKAAAPKPTTLKPVAPKPAALKTVAAKPAASKPAAPTAASSATKRTTTVTARSTATTVAKKTTSAGTSASTTTTATTKTASARSTASTTRTTTSSTTASSATASAATRKVAPTKTPSATSRPANTATTKSAVNGDVKTKAAPTTTRTPAKPLTNGTSGTASAKPPAARQALLAARSTPSKSGPAKTTPTKPSGSATTKSSTTGTRTATKPTAATPASTTVKMDTKK